MLASSPLHSPDLDPSKFWLWGNFRLDAIKKNEPKKLIIIQKEDFADYFENGKVAGIMNGVSRRISLKRLFILLKQLHLFKHNWVYR